jgi:exodeoxyribonuclease VII large subunit
MSETRQIFTLQQVASSIKKTLEERYKQTYWVKAEMHKLNLYPSGHCFPELLQKEDGKIVAQMNASIWKQNYQRINKNFVEVVKEPLREDSTLLLLVKIVFHETFGLSLQILDIDSNYALGELQRERQETLLKLQKENLLNLNQKLSFPLLPKRIALISADTSKGLSDFRKVIDTNQWNYTFFTFLFQAYLQGDVAVASIQEQLKRIEKVKEHFDVVVIVRGGGGEVGLSCYNNFELCKAIAQFPLPVLTGIGHSTNLTVAEMVAFRNAITPTELGDFLIQAFHDFAVPVKDASKTIRNYAKNKLEHSNQALNSTVKLFKNVTSQRIGETKNKLSNASISVRSNVKYALQKERETITYSQKSILKSVKELFSLQNKEIKYQGETLGRTLKSDLKNKEFELNRQTQNLPRLVENILSKNNSNLKQLEQSIKLMDPVHVLKRGYSISLIDGKTITNESKIKQGTTLITKTYFGEIESEILKIKDNKI